MGVSRSIVREKECSLLPIPLRPQLRHPFPLRDEARSGNERFCQPLTTSHIGKLVWRHCTTANNAIQMPHSLVQLQASSWISKAETHSQVHSRLTSRHLHPKGYFTSRRPPCSKGEGFGSFASDQRQMACGQAPVVC